MAKEKNKKLDSSGAYTVLKDPQRFKYEENIDDILSDPSFPKRTGLFLTEMNEEMPIYSPQANAEFIISRNGEVGDNKGHSGSRIVFTKDNYGHRGTGLGGHGFTMCEAIDIVAGSLTCEEKLRTSNTQSRANFITDGARIYLTERGDIQHYFGLGASSDAVAVTSKLKSGIGIKSDHTIIMGRELVRIVVGKSLAEGGDRTACGQKILSPKIELGLSSGGDSQPAVLGSALVEYLMETSDEMQRMRNDIQALEQKLIEYKTALALHTHNGAGLGYVQIFPSPEAIQDAAQSIPQFFKTTLKQIRDTWNSLRTDYKRLGTRDGVMKGTIQDRILSSTVYIGK